MTKTLYTAPVPPVPAPVPVAPVGPAVAGGRDVVAAEIAGLTVLIEAHERVQAVAAEQTALVSVLRRAREQS